MRRRKNGQFAKKLKPWNKGLKGIHLSLATEFKKGQHIGEKHPSWKGGVQNNKLDCVYLWDGANNGIRRPRQVYEDHYGPIEKGFVIYHKDGDRYNDDPENLEAISRAELVKRNKNKNKRLL